MVFNFLLCIVSSDSKKPAGNGGTLAPFLGFPACDGSGLNPPNSALLEVFFAVADSCVSGDTAALPFRKWEAGGARSFSEIAEGDDDPAWHGLRIHKSDG